jgi:hypothetical protein
MVHTVVLAGTIHMQNVIKIGSLSQSNRCNISFQTVFSYLHPSIINYKHNIMVMVRQQQQQQQVSNGMWDSSIDIANVLEVP